MPLVAAAAITAGGALLASNSANKGAKAAAQASQTATNTATAEQRRQYDLSRSDMQPWLNTGRGALGQLANLYGIPQTQAQPAGGFSPVSGGGGVMGGQGLAARWGMGDGATMGAQSVGTGQVGAAQPVPSGGAAAPGQPGQMGSFFASPDYQFRLNESMRALTARNAALGIQDSGAAQRSALGLAGNMASGEFNNYANRLSALAGVGQTAAQNNASLGANFANSFTNAQMNNAQNLGSSYQQQGQNNANLWGSLAGIGTGFINQRWPAK